MQPYIGASMNYTAQPNASMFKNHIHDTYEIFCFVSGSAKYFIEGNIYDLQPDDILLIKRSETHALMIDKEVPYTRYVVNFNAPALLNADAEQIISRINQKPLGKFNKINGSSEQKRFWLYCLKKIVSEKDIKQQQAYLSALIKELAENIDFNNNESNQATNDYIIIEYINRNLFDITSLEEICSRFYISKAHLNRRFRSITGTTVWNYIAEKRLIAAKDLLLKGAKPIHVSEKCSYQEYSSFYRAYKKRFGHAPKDIKKTKSVQQAREKKKVTSGYEPNR